MSVLKAVQDVTDRIAARSADTRRDYLDRIDAAREAGRLPRRAQPAATSRTASPPARPSDKAKLAGNKALNLGIVTSYNDMLSAHQPYQFYPDIIKDAARAIGATAQVAGGVPAMCDGVTQGQPGMDLSLFSATSSPWRRRSRSATTCSTPRSFSASATRSCRAC